MCCYHALSDIIQIVSSVVKTLMNIWCSTVFLCRRYYVLLPIYVVSIRHNVVTATTGHFQSGRLLYCVFSDVRSCITKRLIVFIVGRCLEVVDMSVLCPVDPVNTWHMLILFMYGHNVSNIHISMVATVVFCFFSWLQ